MDNASVDPHPLREITEAMGDGGDLARSLVEGYTARLPDMMSALREAVEAGDHQRVVQIAHDFKSTSELLGARVFAGKLREVELAALSGRSVPMPQLSVDQLMTNLAAAVDSHKD